MIDDDDIYERSKQVFERYNRGETAVVSILVRNCQWRLTAYGKVPILPRNQKPIATWERLDDALTVVVGDLAESIGELIRIEIIAEQPPTGPADAPTTDETVAPLEPTGQTAPATGDAATAEVESAAVREARAVEEEQEKEAAAAAEVQPAAIEEEAAAVEEGETAEPIVEANPHAVAPARYRIDPLPRAPVAVDWRKDYYRTGFLKRGLAYTVDTLIFFVLALALVTVLGEGLGFTIYLGAFFLGLPAFEASRWRATPGKRIFRLQVSDQHGNRISYWRAVWRNLLRLLVYYSYIFIVPAIIQYFRFRKTRKLFHDEISGTEIGEHSRV